MSTAYFFNLSILWLSCFHAAHHTASKLVALHTCTVCIGREHSADEKERPLKRMKLEEEDSKEPLPQAAGGVALDKEVQCQRTVLVILRFHPQPSVLTIIKMILCMPIVHFSWIR